METHSISHKKSILSWHITNIKIVLQAPSCVKNLSNIFDRTFPRRQLTGKTFNYFRKKAPWKSLIKYVHEIFQNTNISDVRVSGGKKC